jgi:hypothetical protein
LAAVFVVQNVVGRMVDVVSVWCFVWLILWSKKVPGVLDLFLSGRENPLGIFFCGSPSGSILGLRG